MKKESKNLKSITERNSNDKSQDYYIKAGDTIYLHIDNYIPISSEINISKRDYNKLKLQLAEITRTTFRDFIEQLKKSK